MADQPMKKIGKDTPPQYRNTRGGWDLVIGEDGAYLVKPVKIVASKPFGGSTTMTKEFAQSMVSFLISNDGTENLTFTVNDGDGAGDTYIVYAGAVWDEALPLFTSVTITTSVPFQAWGRYELVPIVEDEPVDTIPPENVTGLTPSNITPSSVTLTWQPSSSNDTVGYDIYRGVTKIATVSGTTVNITGLSPNTQYTFIVKAKDGSDNISSGTQTTIDTPASSDTTPPDNVTNLTKSNETATGATISWTGTSDAVSYDIYNGSSFVSNVSTTNYNLIGLTPSTTYTIWVKAKDAAGNAASGVQIQVTTTAAADTTPPANVTSVSASSLTQTSATLTWPASASSDVASYDIYNGITFVTNVTGLTYNVTSLTAGTQYTFWVKAKDAAGNVATGTSTTFTTSAATDTTPPNPVTGLAATTGSITTSSVPLTWSVSSSSDVASQEVAYSSNGGSTYTVASASVNPSSNAFTVTGLAAGTAYTFRVIAVDGAGNRSTAATTTASTTAAADTTPPGPPTGLTAGTPANSTIPSSWTAPGDSDVAKYEVAYSTDGTNFTIASANVTGTSYTITGLNASTLYTIRVAAIDTSNNRSSGNPITTATTTTTTGKVNDASLILYQDNPALNQTIPNPDNYFHNADHFTAFVTVQPIGSSNSAATFFSRLSPNAVKFELTWDSKFVGTLTGKNSNGTGTANFPTATSSPTVYTDHSVSYHVVFVRDATKIYIYVNNVLLQQTLVASDFYVDPSTSPLLFAGTVQAGVTFKNMGYYNRALTTAELTQNYNALK